MREAHPFPAVSNGFIVSKAASKKRLKTSLMRSLILKYAALLVEWWTYSAINAANQVHYWLDWGIVTNLAIYWPNSVVG